MLDEITLKGLSTASDPTAKAVHTETSTTVFCEPKSVKRSEFYAADAAGQSIDIVFIVNSDEYTGQKEATYNGVDYTIVRSYEVGRRTELTCARR